MSTPLDIDTAIATAAVRSGLTVTQVWSCGGGTQSAAIAALIIQGRLPKPDLSLIVDTNREKTRTWEYFDSVLKPECAKAGVDIVRVDRSKYATVDLYSQNGNDLLIPAFSTITGERSKMPGLCSNEWKQRVSHRWLREHGVERGEIWMGISTDEMRRVRVSPLGWLQNRYPLIFDVPMRRSDCVALVQQMGWPDPPRSSCWMCPNMRDREWRELPPGDLAMAVELERDVRKRDPHAFLHELCIPLEDVDFTTNQMPMFGDDNACASGYCFV